MDKKLIMREIISALVMAVLIAGVSGIIATIFGGNFMTEFTFMGLGGYEATGELGIIFGLPVGGMLGSYLVRRRFTGAEQKPVYTIGIGLLVGSILLTIFFAGQIREGYDQLRYNAGTGAIETQYPEIKNLNCFASCSYKYDKDGDDYYFAYIENGSGVPIAKATCFKFDKDSQVTKVGEYPNPSDSYNLYQDINPKDCRGIK